MNRFLSLRAFALVLSCLSVAVRAIAADDSDKLVGSVRTIFEQHCVDCHSQAKSRVEKKLDLTDLVAVSTSKRLVNPTDPEKSKLYEKISDGAMPPDDNEPIKAPLSAEETAQVLAWIKAGAPPPRGAADTTGRFVSTKVTIREIFQDLLEIDEHDRPFIRYLTLTVSYNAGDTDAELDLYRLAVSKLLNSLSRKPKIATVTAIGTGRTLLRFDLRDIGWPAAKWDYLLARYPYAVEFAGADSALLASAGGSPVVYLRADWFAFSATQPDNYHFLLDLPSTAKELEHSLGFDAAANIAGNRVIRGAIGPKRSGVSDHNRLVERHEIENYLGGYWKSYDFGSSIGEKNLIERPLGPGHGEIEFAHDGGELIFNLPNGLQAYLLVNAEGRRINEGPQKIVNDRTALEGTVILNGISCMKCHADGMLDVADEVRRRLERAPAGYPADLRSTIERLYPGQARLSEVLKTDRDRFRKALTEAGAKREGGPEPISSLVRRFLRPVNINTAHAEVGLPRAEFQQRLGQSLVLAGVRDDLQETDVSRENFIALFTTLVTELRLGKPQKLAFVRATPPTSLIKSEPPVQTVRPSSAAVELRWSTTDLAKIYDNHPKTLRENTAIQAADADARKKVEQLNAAGNVLVEEYRKLVESKPSAAQAKLEQIQAKKKEVDDLVTATRAELQKRLQTFRTAMLAEIVGELATRAQAAQVDLLFDTAGPTAIGVSSLLYADPALALPDGARPNIAPRAIKLVTVDLAKLYDNHPSTTAQNAKITADDQQAQREVDRLNQEGNRLLEEYKRLLESGTKEQAEAKLRAITAKQEEVKTFIANTREALGTRLKTFREVMLADISREVVDAARARGASVVVDVAGPSTLGISNIIYVAPDFDLDAVRKTGVARALGKVATIDLARLYDNHPKTGDFTAKVRRDEALAQTEVEKMNAEGNELVERYKQLRARADNASLSGVARSEAEAEANKILERARAKQKEVADFIENTRKTLTHRQQSFRDVLLAEIATAVAEQAKHNDIDLVLDVAGPTFIGVSPIVYSANRLDLTSSLKF